MFKSLLLLIFSLHFFFALSLPTCKRYFNCRICTLTKCKYLASRDFSTCISVNAQQNFINNQIILEDVRNANYCPTPAPAPRPPVQIRKKIAKQVAFSTLPPFRIDLVQDSFEASDEEKRVFEETSTSSQRKDHFEPSVEDERDEKKEKKAARPMHEPKPDKEMQQVPENGCLSWKIVTALNFLVFVFGIVLFIFYKKKWNNNNQIHREREHINLNWFGRNPFNFSIPY